MNSRLQETTYYDAAMGANLGEIISEPRMAKYMRYANGDVSRASELYKHNLELSKAAYGALQMCELVLRNAIDKELKTWCSENKLSPDWALSCPPLIVAALGAESDEIGKARDKARKALRRSGATPTHDDVIAQMSFGTWRYILPGKKPHTAKDKLWDESLRGAFGNLSPHTSRDTLTYWVMMAYDLRNRVAHHEPIFHNDVRGKRRAMRDIVQSVSNDSRKWFAEHDTLSDAINSYQQFCSQNGINLALSKGAR